MWALVAVAGIGAALPLIGVLRYAHKQRAAASREQESDVVPSESLDEPIVSRRQDALGRVGYANLVASELRDELRGEAAVFAITGAWGSGKTSFLNMIEEALSEAPQRVVLRFNPWLFAGAEQLMARFFQELAAQVRVALPPTEDQLGHQLEAYGHALAPLHWLPVAGTWIARASQLAVASANYRSRRTHAGSIEAKRDLLERGLRRLPEPIFVFIDDVDRLEAREIRELLRLVRLVAHLPNVVYVLAFDETQVEKALGSEGLDGRAYLGKIVQRSFDLPSPAPDRIGEVLLAALGAALEGLETGPFESERWPDVLAEIVLPLVRNLRDAKRYVAGAASSVKALGGEVALVDVLGLEAIRIFLPQSFALITIARTALAGAESELFGARATERDPRLDRFLESSDRPEVLRAVCDRLFPGTSGQLGGSHYGSSWLGAWRGQQRVAHPELLNYYLHRVPTKAMLSMRASRLIANAMLAGDAAGMADVLDSIDEQLLEEVIEGLEDFEREFDESAAHAGVPVLARWYGRLPKTDRGMFHFSPDLKIGRVILRLLRVVPDESTRAEIVRDALVGLSLYGEYQLLTLVGHRENAGHELLDQPTMDVFEDALRRDIVGSRQGELTDAPALSLLYWALKTSKGTLREQVDRALQDPGIAAATLADALTEVRSQAMGSRVVNRENRLAWDPLVEVFGSERAIELAIGTIEAAGGGSPERVRDAIALARRYLGGWRPNDFPDS